LNKADPSFSLTDQTFSTVNFVTIPEPCHASVNGGFTLQEFVDAFPPELLSFVEGKKPQDAAKLSTKAENIAQGLLNGLLEKALGDSGGKMQVCRRKIVFCF
jgi:hypothetical protein